PGMIGKGCADLPGWSDPSTILALRLFPSDEQSGQSKDCGRVRPSWQVGAAFTDHARMVGYPSTTLAVSGFLVTREQSPEMTISAARLLHAVPLLPRSRPWNGGTAPKSPNGARR